jgi:gamma-glutamyl:cysteine ligase YbdK (ATP-grasp superfamily)
MFLFGIEHEVAFLKDRNKFADFTCTQFETLNQIIEQLPTYDNDYAQLRIGDAGIKKKRWYIEGFERFSEHGKVIDCIPKGIEIRTTIHSSIQGAIAELSESFVLLRQTAVQFGLVPVLTSFNPNQAAYQPQPPLNHYEQQRRLASPEKQTAQIPMLTYGPDLNFSIANLSTEQWIDIGRKLTFYSAYLVPFSFSSPFYQGKLWQGLSVRTYLRTGARPAALVFVAQPSDLIASTPSLTKIARVPAEVGRIEFKAFDSCDDFQMYAALLALLKGLALDRTLPGRATVPDADLHQLSALHGATHATIRQGMMTVMQAAKAALDNDPDQQLLQRLQPCLDQPVTTAHRLIDAFRKSGSIERSLQQTYTNSM